MRTEPRSAPKRASSSARNGGDSEAPPAGPAAPPAATGPRGAGNATPERDRVVVGSRFSTLDLATGPCVFIRPLRARATSGNSPADVDRLRLFSKPSAQARQPTGRQNFAMRLDSTV